MVEEMIAPKDAENLDLNDIQPKSNFPPSGPSLKAKGICVVLDKDADKEDLEATIQAISLLKGVAVVKYIDFDAFHDYSNRTRAKMELLGEIGETLKL